jgi:hypothetical protein
MREPPTIVKSVLKCLRTSRTSVAGLDATAASRKPLRMIPDVQVAREAIEVERDIEGLTPTFPLPTPATCVHGRPSLRHLS